MLVNGDKKHFQNPHNPNPYSILRVLTEAAKKVIFIMSVPVRPYHPPPSSLMAVGFFVFFFFLSHKTQADFVFFPQFLDYARKKFLPTNFNVICAYIDVVNNKIFFFKWQQNKKQLSTFFSS